MSEVTILGGGEEARVCTEALTSEGLSPRHAFELDADDASPVIVGEVQGGFQLAREAVAAGRHVLIAAASLLTPERLALLLQERQRSQALFVWNEGRYHPGFRFVSGLIETDSSWRPRYVRHETMSAEQTSRAAFRYRSLEALALVNSIAGDEPLSLAATGVLNVKRNAPDLVSLRLCYEDLDALIVIGMGEGFERRETLLAAPTRKVLIDGLSQTSPVRVVDTEVEYETRARRVSCPVPSAQEAVRQQCCAFLAATLQPRLARSEAAVWQRSLAALDAIDRSLAADGASIRVSRGAPEPRFRLIRSTRSPAPTAA